MKTVVTRTWTAAPAVSGHATAFRGPACSQREERHGGVLAAIVLAVLCAAAAALLPTPAAAAPLAVQTAIFGIAEDQNIYTIDPATGLVTGSASTASLSLVGDKANAFALDRAKAQIYFMGDSSVTGSNSLFYYDQTSGTLGLVATAAQLGVTQMERNASFYDGKFWWIGINDNTLHRATINYTAGLPSSVTLADPISIIGTGSISLNPNDIAINPVTQMLYGSDLTTTSTPSGSGEFFSISLASLAGLTAPYTKLYDQPVVSGTQVGLQLAYNDDYSTLYGQNYVTGEWYTVSTGTGGTFTATGGVTTDPALKMRDLAGGVQAVPEPGTLALAGSGILIAGVVICRGRSRRRRNASQQAAG